MNFLTLLGYVKTPKVSSCVLWNFSTFDNLVKSKSMSQKKIQISIPNPCSEDWSKMTPTERGRFCAMCTTEVVDFTGMTDEALVSKLTKSDEYTCGRVTQTQLNKEFVLNQERRSSRLPNIWYERIFASGLFVLSLGSAKSQSPMAMMPISENQVVLPSSEFDNTSHLHRNAKTDQHKIALSGVLLDSLTNEPIAFAKVVLETFSKGVMTDYDGNFELIFFVDEVPDSIELLIVSPGFGRKTLTLHKEDFDKPLEIYLAANETEITIEMTVGRMVVVGALQYTPLQPETKSQSFWRRMKFWKRRK